MSDPFAAAAMAPAAAPPAPKAPAPAADPFNAEINLADPFATPETVNAGGGDFRRAPGMDTLIDRLVVYIPRTFRNDAPDPFSQEQGAVRDQFACDLYILDGGDLSWTYVKKDDKGGETEASESIAASDLPAEFPGTFVTQKALIGQLRRISGTAKPLLMGVIRRGPKADARKAGKSFDDVEAAYSAYVQAMTAWGGRGTKPVEPAFSWQVDTDVSPERRAAAMAWWQGAQRTIKPLGPVQDLSGTGK